MEEAHNGQYEIVEDEDEIQRKPIPIELGGTGGSTAKSARESLGVGIENLSDLFEGKNSISNDGHYFFDTKLLKVGSEVKFRTLVIVPEELGGEVFTPTNEKENLYNNGEKIEFEMSSDIYPECSNVTFASNCPLTCKFFCYILDKDNKRVDFITEARIDPVIINRETKEWKIVIYSPVIFYPGWFNTSYGAYVSDIEITGSWIVEEE
jgi:hypothetical protein